MDPIQPGSRGAARLLVNGSRSHDGADVGTALITSQEWFFPVEQASSTPTFSLSSIDTQAGPSTCAKLAPASIPRSSNRLGLYPHDKAEAGSSVDADVLSAQRFLRHCYPDIDIPDHLVSRIIYDDALELDNTAHELDGSLGLADAQAIALLGPVTIEQEPTYAVACVGGSNRDCLLLHQLTLEADNDVIFDACDESKADTAQGKGKAKAKDPVRLRFQPALSAERKFQTPILQVVSSADQSILAVRTHSSTSFLSLRQVKESDSTPRLHLETVYQTRYGTDGSAQHQDISFSRTASAIEAATVDRYGNIDLFRFAAEDADAEQSEHRPDQRTSGSSAATPTQVRAKRRQSFPAASPSPALASRPSQITARKRRVAIDLASLADTDAREDADAVADADDAAAEDAQASNQAPFRIVFGSMPRELYLSTRHALVRINLGSQDADTEGGSAPQVHVVLRSSLCLSSFKRERFFSMATTERDLQHQLLAVCSSDAIHWFDLKDPAQLLFSTAHHRGDDPTLFLSVLPTGRGTVSGSAQNDDGITVWTLSSKRNDAVTCYAVRAHSREGRGYDLLQADTAMDSSGTRVRYTLDSAPVILPTDIPSSRSLGTRAAPMLFINVAALLQRDHPPESWISLRLDEGGALSAQMLQASFDPPSDTSGQAEVNVALHVMGPPFGSDLYLDDARDPQPIRGMVDSLSEVKTKHLDLRNVHHAVFASKCGDTRSGRRSDASGGEDVVTSHLRDLLNRTSKSNPGSTATMLSFGHILRDLDDGSLTHIDNDEGEARNQAKDVLDLRHDCRHALSSLALSTAQARWTRATAGLVHHDGNLGPAIESHVDVIERTLKRESGRLDDAMTSYLPTKKTAQTWSAKARREARASLKKAAREMMLDLVLESEVFVRPRARILDTGAPTQRPQERRGTNWTALEYRDIYNFVEEQGETIPPPHIGSVGLSFFAPMRSADVEKEAAELAKGRNGSTAKLSEIELEALLPSTSSTARLLLSEWQLSEDPTEYKYTDPFEGLHRLPRASRLRGPTARARSRSFSRASSASTEDRSRSRSRNRKQSAAPSMSQSGVYDSQPPSSSYPASLASHSQFDSAASPAPPTLVSRRKRPRDNPISRSQPVRAPMQGFESPRPNARDSRGASEAAQSQPAAIPRFGFAGSFGDLTPTVSPASSQVGTPTRSHFTTGAASTQIEAGRFGARPAAAVERPPKKKKRASGF
ncbi:hypothetical protein PSEUBRA_003860 [Kalmanozyma brasiliensis GHG001]|uniref:uncharacterized protein n=1 Tax=Kalmanozyma brasiliensis (strain GHG001) TaxID=1365824 RepID=UPI001CE967FE|nr:uncharacterized protein PSEUBRA_003860 [Kalmanozyma brasiliensis GHG001]KAF6767302.1 hypothetical protein PSEUBRA_003860 [Kalmanozyma brasiliensis GHG001]